LTIYYLDGCWVKWMGREWRIGIKCSFVVHK
jgi:hypothetical protein